MLNKNILDKINEVVTTDKLTVVNYIHSGIFDIKDGEQIIASFSEQRDVEMFMQGYFYGRWKKKE